MNQNGQTSVEYLITTSFLLVITGIIFAYGLFIYTDTVANSTANSAVSGIINAVNQVYALGPGSVLFITVDTPRNVHRVFTENSETTNRTALVFELQGTGGLTQISETSQTRFDFYNSDWTLGQIQKEGRYPLKVFWITSTIQVCLTDQTGNCQGTGP